MQTHVLPAQVCKLHAGLAVQGDSVRMSMVDVDIACTNARDTREALYVRDLEVRQ